MRYEIEFAPEAIDDLRKLSASIRRAVLDAVELHLRHTPTVASKIRTKRLRGMSRPQYRLCVHETRVFYDVSTEGTVEILAIVPKLEVKEWLERVGKRT